MNRSFEHDPEPLCINAVDVEEFLERRGRPGMASYVRDLAMRDRQTTLRIDLITKRHYADMQELYERLAKYEPPAEQHERTRYTPPPEASD